MDAEDRIERLGIELPAAPQSLASYVPVRVAGEFAFVSGQVPMERGRLLWSGTVGRDLDADTGAVAARRCALQALSALRYELGSLDRVTGVVKVTVFVASAGGFTDHPSVANGASDLLVEVFGEEGRHARAAVGVQGLPLGAPVEVELVCRLALRT